MTTKQYDFFGCPAYLKQVLGPRTCEVWLSKAEAMRYSTTLADGVTPSFARLDLGATPTATLQAGAAVQVDDFIDGLTTLGKQWPGSSRDGHAAEGAVYLEKTLWEAERKAGRIAWPPFDGTEDYQYQSRLYVGYSESGLPSYRRYYGFRARLLAQLSAGAAVFELSEAYGGSPRQVWVKLDALEQCDGTASFAEAGAVGPLFLSWPFARDHNLKGPKLPVGLEELTFAQLLLLASQTGLANDNSILLRGNRAFAAATLGHIAYDTLSREAAAFPEGIAS